MAKILIVEDNEMNRDMLSRRLIRRGFEIIIAIDGAQGIAAAKTQKPDLVLMDMSLPVLDGWEATRGLKAEPLTCANPRHRAQLPTQWRATAKGPSRRAATTTTQSQSNCPDCCGRSRRSSPADSERS